MKQVIPTEALIAAKEAMREVTPPPGVSKADWLAEHGSFALVAGALAAADAVMFDDAAIERAAIALGVKQYPMIEGFWIDVDPDFRDKCRDQARAVIAALKGDDK